MAGAGGFALLASMFLHWYGLALPGGPEATAWQAFSVLDVVLALLALVPFALVFMQATRDSAALPVLFSVPTTSRGRDRRAPDPLPDRQPARPDDVVEVEAGAWLAFLAAVVVAAGGWPPCGGGDARAARASGRAHARALIRADRG